VNRVVPPVLLLHSDRAFRERVRRACVGRFGFRLLTSWPALRDAVEGMPSAALVIVDPFEPGPSFTLARELRSLLRDFPSVTVLAACQLRSGALEAVRSLGEWGVTRMISLGEDDTPLALARVLQSAQGRPLRSLLHRSLPTSLGARARAIVMAAAEVVSAGEIGRDLARALCITPRTLQRWCRRSGLPAPRQLLAWMRLLLAAELLDDAGRSVLGAALACGYSSDAALRTTFRAYLGVSPTALREQGAFQTVSRRFVEALASSHAPPPPPARRAIRAAGLIPLRSRAHRGTGAPEAQATAADGGGG
jgi:AraC-like DNA-binding protein